jgi:cytidine diphosphoramidate kinase
MVIWIIGLSGSGKSFLAEKLKSKIKNSMIVDGDEVRKFITYKLGYSKKDRKQNSKVISDICAFLENQGINVICPILSIFTDHQKKNRKRFKKYFQIYIKSNIQNLKKRNSKKIYTNKKNVVGLDIKFPTPYKSDLVINNDYKKVNTRINIQLILKRILR